MAGEFSKDLKHWNYDSFLIYRNKSARKLLSKIYKQIFGSKRYRTTLELACGPGCNLPLTSKYSHNVVAIDWSEKMIERAKNLIKSKGIDNVEAKVMDVYDLKFSEGTFDCVFGYNVLHHTPKEKAIKESSRVLKKGGVYLGIEPNILNPLTAIMHLFRKDEYGAFIFHRFRLRKLLKKYYKEVRFYPLNLTVIKMNPFTLALINIYDLFTRIYPLSIFSINVMIYAEK